MIEVLWVIAGFVVIVLTYLLSLAVYWLYERLRFTPEERWQRRYDRQLKKHFKSF
ncbi:MAG: DUF1320 domain-containing protein [Verrucomicrobiales bacterium]|jgi:hypothetical protein|nr:DUF1320 domain-containing protein [Verrucomicrobiales bacterium]